MGSLTKLKNESLTDFADRVASIYVDKSKASKKEKGQFFTSILVARYMASLVGIKGEAVSILDPGAGIGILSVALIEELTKNTQLKNIRLVCYETDKQVLPYLKAVLEEAKKQLSKVYFEYRIVEKDFVTDKGNALTTDLNSFNNSDELFDMVVSNPPYFKLNKTDSRLLKFSDVVSGQPNIYFLFMALSAKLLKKNGEMIFITPRSFCSGLYYSKFRKWLIKKVNFANIHLFESRKDLFANQEVLQENIITRFTKEEPDSVIISKTGNGDFSTKKETEVTKNDVIYRSNGHIFFRIPSNQEEVSVIRKLDKLPFNFYKLGIKISTGKVVAFRNRKFLQNELKKDSIPYIWMHNIRNGKVEWPLSKKEKAIAIKNSAETQKLLLKAGNYLVLKRFTTKEQKKRFDTACIYKEEFEKQGYFALDNMVNYIHSTGKPLTKNLVKGIAKYLDLPIVESYFRILNGHTQVNANEVYALPFPSLEELENFGKVKAPVTFSSIRLSKQSRASDNEQLVLRA